MSALPKAVVKRVLSEHAATLVLGGATQFQLGIFGQFQVQAGVLPSLFPR